MAKDGRDEDTTGDENGLHLVPEARVFWAVACGDLHGRESGRERERRERMARTGRPGRGRGRGKRLERVYQTLGDGWSNGTGLAPLWRADSNFYISGGLRATYLKYQERLVSRVTLVAIGNCADR